MFMSPSELATFQQCARTVGSVVLDLGWATIRFVTLTPVWSKYRSHESTSYDIRLTIRDNKWVRLLAYAASGENSACCCRMSGWLHNGAP
jgi:hypothetical protein